MTTASLEQTFAAAVGAQYIASGGELSAFAVDGVVPGRRSFRGCGADGARDEDRGAGAHIGDGPRRRHDGVPWPPA